MHARVRTHPRQKPDRDATPTVEALGHTYLLLSTSDVLPLEVYKNLFDRPRREITYCSLSLSSSAVCHTIMALAGTVDVRFARLFKFLNDVLYGQRSLNTARHGKFFIEAVCVQPDLPACAHRLITSPSGLFSPQASVRFDTSPQFLNEHGVLLLRYIQPTSLEAIKSGSVLAETLTSLVEPPFFWDTFTEAFRDSLLDLSAC